MKLNDEAVLEALHLEPADLSTGRRFVKDAASKPPDADAWNLTRTMLEFRGILTGPGTSTPAETAERPAEAAATHGRRLEESVPQASVVWVPVVPLSQEGFDVLQKFEGTVLSVVGDSFVAQLVDRTHSGPEEEAEIPLAEVMPGDRELVKPGAVFYWVIGYRREVHGQLSRSSVIRFQRVPSWSPADVDRAKRAAETFLSFLDLERANNPA